MSGLRTNSPLEQLLEEIKFQRRKELRTQVTHLYLLLWAFVYEFMDQLRCYAIQKTLHCSNAFVLFCTATVAVFCICTSYSNLDLINSPTLHISSHIIQSSNHLKRSLKRLLYFQDPGFSCTRNTTYWTDLFVRHFLFQSDRSLDSDDLLFFVR